MKRILSTVALAAILLTSTVGAYAGSVKRSSEAPPAAADGELSWDVKVFENNPKAFALVKRVEGDGSLGWVLQVKNTDEEFRIQNYDQNVAHYEALFLDGDDLVLGSVRLVPHSQDVRVGERVRFTLTLPTDEQFAGAKKVVLKLR